MMGRTTRYGFDGEGDIFGVSSQFFSLMRGGQLKPQPQPGAKPELPWQTQERWSHIPAPWRDDPHCVMAATAERSVWVFAAMSDHPDQNTAWLPVALIDVYGRIQSYERNRGRHLSQGRKLPYGQLLRITDPLGRVYQLNYTTIKALFSGPDPVRLASVQLGPYEQSPVLVSYRYGSLGDLHAVSDEHGRITRAFEYDRQHRMTGHRHLGPDGQSKFPHPWPPQIPPGSAARL